jgi:PleD family two-component response regulator
VRVSGAFPVKISGTELPKVTVSIGMTKLRPGNSLETMLASADGALYHAKKAGRDCARFMPGR